MKVMFKIAALAAAIVSLASCEEFQPVFTGQYGKPEEIQPVTVDENQIIKIDSLINIYGKPQNNTAVPLDAEGDFYIRGKVSSNDKRGNFYKSMFIQDETGGIEIKIGRSALYNEYKPGQTIYVKCNGLTLGQYGCETRETKDEQGAGGFSLGYASANSKYQTADMGTLNIIDAHVLKGEEGAPVDPVVLKESDLPKGFETNDTNKNIGKLVTVKGLRYTQKAFYFIYTSNTHADSDRLFFDQDNDRHGSWNVTTWAMSKFKMMEYLNSGAWDRVPYAGKTLGDFKKANGKYPPFPAQAVNVSQYFTSPGGATVAVRTSGYCKFADLEMGKEVFEGKKTVSVTGVINLFHGVPQITVIDENGFVVE